MSARRSGIAAQGRTNDDVTGIAVILLNTAMLATITVDHRLNFKGVFAANFNKALGSEAATVLAAPGQCSAQEQKRKSTSPT